MLEMFKPENGDISLILLSFLVATSLATINNANRTSSVLDHPQIIYICYLYPIRCIYIYIYMHRIRIISYLFQIV